jgi:hypothetical protein
VIGSLDGWRAMQLAEGKIVREGYIGMPLVENLIRTDGEMVAGEGW